MRSPRREEQDVVAALRQAIRSPGLEPDRPAFGSTLAAGSGREQSDEGSLATKIFKLDSGALRTDNDQSFPQVNAKIAPAIGYRQ